MTQELSSKIVEIAHARRRFGYRRIHDMLRPHFPGVNHKRVYRLYSAANLAVRKRKKVKRPANERVPLQLATTVNEVWSNAPSVRPVDAKKTHAPSSILFSLNYQN